MPKRRGLLARLFRGAELGHPTTNTGWGRIIPASDIDPNPIQGPRDALAQYNGWVFAAASFIAEEAAALEWNLWRPTGGDRTEWTLDETHELNDVLRRPNTAQSWGQFLELTDTHYSLAGQAFWHIITDARKAIGLEVIYPHWVREPVVSGGRLTGWKVQRPGAAGTVTLAAEDVVRIYRPHPLSAFMAASTVEAAAASHYFDLYLRAYGMTLFRNDGGIPAGLLTSDQVLTPDQMGYMRETWRQRYGQSRGEVAVLGAGTKYERLGISPGDLKFLEVGQFTRDQVLSLFRVSPALLGITGDSNRANMEAALWGFQRHTLRPRAARYQEALNTRVIPRFVRDDRSLWFEFRDVVSKDRDRLTSESDGMLARGAITVNEHREAMGLKAVPGGDVYLLPSNVTITSSLEPKEPVESGRDALPPAVVTASARPLLESGRDMEVAAARMTAARLEAENRRLKIEAREQKIYRDLRGLFSKHHRLAKAEGLERVVVPVEELERRGVNPNDLKPTPGEDLTAHAERLKSEVAKTLAHAIAEREVA